ncbi:anaerobic ribonucleoside-triphosphate reductase activating enzyme [Desulfovibrio ferrophilus]|uniref:Anaerobic ribonucleoside-triphosphate reductase activating enzyme n=2 Tax=Desulfovibrio ferrophilus TaxID=241368 RepID=A0A2Z6AU11_9BACT|nr:anaerobic ribonucleoside-triphosphate reductase activating enzyme [Desulfovibrio ferrophilus]
MPEELPAVDRTRVMSYLENRKMWLDGITVTGGEPTAVPDVAALIDDISCFGLPVKMDSNGMRPEVVEELLRSRLVHTFAVDVKGPFDKYPALTGGAATQEQASANMDHIFGLAAANPQSFYFRITKVPLLTKDDIETARGYLPTGFELIEQNFVPPGRNQHAQTDPEKRRMSGDVVSRSNRGSNPESLEVQRHSGPPAVQALGA